MARAPRTARPVGEEAARTLALSLLKQRPHGPRELVRKLQTRHVPAELARELVARFERNGLVDERRFAEWYARALLKRRPQAPRLLVEALQVRGVAREVAEAAVGRLAGAADEPRLAEDLARRWLGRGRVAETPGAWRRLASYLARRGFGEETVRRAVRRVGGSDDDLG